MTSSTSGISLHSHSCVQRRFEAFDYSFSCFVDIFVDGGGGG